MSEDQQQGEYSTPRGDGTGVRRLPDGRERTPTFKERMQDARSAGMRDEPLPHLTRPGLQVRR